MEKLSFDERAIMMLEDYLKSAFFESDVQQVYNDDHLQLFLGIIPEKYRMQVRDISEKSQFLYGEDNPQNTFDRIVISFPHLVWALEEPDHEDRMQAYRERMRHDLREALLLRDVQLRIAHGDTDIAFPKVHKLAGYFAASEATPTYRVSTTVAPEGDSDVIAQFDIQNGMLKIQRRHADKRKDPETIWISTAELAAIEIAHHHAEGEAWARKLHEEDAEEEDPILKAAFEDSALNTERGKKDESLRLEEEN